MGRVGDVGEVFGGCISPGWGDVGQAACWFVRVGACAGELRLMGALTRAVKVTCRGKGRTIRGGVPLKRMQQGPPLLLGWFGCAPALEGTGRIGPGSELLLVAVCICGVVAS